jgi:hypothetical protein
MKNSVLAIFCIFIYLLLLGSCTFFEEETFIDDGKNIRFKFDEGLNEDPRFRLPKDANGYYYMTLTKEGQNIQRISARLLDGDKIVDTKCCGPRQKVTWSSNLYWWILAGDTVANITKTYFNTFTGQLQYSNLPPLINWKDELVPTVNSSTYTDEFTGRGSTVIAPIGKMKGDTLTVYARYYHSIASYTAGSSFYTVVGSLEIVDSVKIVLR